MPTCTPYSIDRYTDNCRYCENPIRLPGKWSLEDIVPQSKWETPPAPVAGKGSFTSLDWTRFFSKDQALRIMVEANANSADEE